MALIDTIRSLFQGDLARNIYEIVALQTDVMAGVVNSAVSVVDTTTLTLTDDHNGFTILCTNAAGCTVTVPVALSQGFSCMLVQDAAGAVTLSASGVTFLASAAVAAPYTTADQGSAIVLTRLPGTRVLICGGVS